MEQMIHIKNLNIYIYPQGKIQNEAQSFHSKYKEKRNNSENVSYYPKEEAPDGVYFLSHKGNCWKKDCYNQCNELIKGIAVIDGKKSIVVCPDGSLKDIVLLEGEKDTPANTYKDYLKALEDNSGYNNTELLFREGSDAAQYCKSFGEEWYLPTLSEMCLMYKYEDVDKCLEIMGADPLYKGWHWTSTKRCKNSYFVFDWGDGDRDDCVQDGILRVRPVSALF